MLEDKHKETIVLMIMILVSFNENMIRKHITVDGIISDQLDDTIDNMLDRLDNIRDTYISNTEYEEISKRMKDQIIFD